MSPMATTDRGAAILARTIVPEEGNLPVEAARSILCFHLAPTDWQRVNELAVQARAGTLTAEERAELDEYERITKMSRQLKQIARSCGATSARC